MLPFDRFKALTFDCYGTLIDWESGILGALRPVLAGHRITCPDEDLLAIYAEAEASAESEEYAPYREVLRRVMRSIGGRLRFAATVAEEECLAASIADWLPFPDTVAALRALQERYRLAIVSNIDDDLFRASAVRLEVPFDAVITAQMVRGYKPGEGHFKRALEVLDLAPGEILHVAQSLFHDVVPARRLGMSTVWVNRRHGREGSGATPPAEATPDLEVPDLRSLARLAASSRRA